LSVFGQPGVRGVIRLRFALRLISLPQTVLHRTLKR
jgi:hypothetical protein